MFDYKYMNALSYKRRNWGGGVHVYTDEKIGKKNNWYICQMIKRKQSNMG